MQVLYAHLCDYALLSSDGKLSLLGLSTRLTVPQLPAVHPQAFLAFVSELDYTDLGRDMELRIECVDADGRAVLAMRLHFKAEAATTPKIRDRTQFPQILRLNNIKLERAGAHDINIFVNNEPKARVSFDVAVATPPPGGGGKRPRTPPPESA